MTTFAVAQEELNKSGALEAFTVYQLLLIQTQLLFDILGGGSSMTTLAQAQAKLDEAGCLNCFTAYQLALIQSQLLIDIAAGGGGGSSCLLCGDVDPVAAPTCECGLYYNRISGGVWVWIAGPPFGPLWLQVIGG